MPSRPAHASQRDTPRAWRCLAALLLLTAAACNHYHTPIAIDPRGELARSTQFVAAGNAKFHVPAGWTLENVLRDPKFPGASIRLRRSNGRDVLGNMLLVAQQSKPDWLTGPDVRTTSTDRHQQVRYRLETEVAPSGDDTPGRYALDAWAESPETSWELHVGFLHPVEGGVEPAIKYVDALEFTPRPLTSGL